jgi:MinD-like ATPase involved in chromosome partitioning or flagellar assembly
MTKCIAFHSYKGGSGKTTLACNSAAALAKKGFNVCLLDLDLYAPSFQIYFQKEPSKGINDFLDTNARVEDVMVDVTNIINDVKIVDTSNSNDRKTYSSLKWQKQTQKRRLLGDS